LDFYFVVSEVSEATKEVKPKYFRHE
jgi:hypothetical protein